jgi:hypothetical protein
MCVEGKGSPVIRGIAGKKLGFRGKGVAREAPSCYNIDYTHVPNNSLWLYSWNCFVFCFSS